MEEKGGRWGKGGRVRVKKGREWRVEGEEGGRGVNRKGGRDGW